MRSALKVLFFALSLLLAAAPLQAQETRQSSVHVNGQAEIRVVPDHVILTLGVETDDRSLAKATAENDRRSGAVLAAAKRQGVATKDLKTDFISIDRITRTRKDEQIESFFVRKTLVVTLRDIEAFEDLMAAVLQAGANHLQGVDFRTSKLREHRDEARRKAIQAAKEKAQLLAGELGRNIGKARDIREGQGGWWSNYGSFWRGGRGFAAQNTVAEAGTGGLSDTIAPGEISITASVSVTFELL
jgi:uncharacterized protein YggE